MAQANGRTGKRVLALVTDSYGGYGGIAAYNRDVCDALAADDRISEVVVVPRSIVDAVERLPLKLQLDQSAARGPMRFLASALRRGLAGGSWDLIYCAHINLAPVAALISRATRTPWALALYGIEAWKPSGRGAVDRVAGKAHLYLSISQLTLDRFRGIWPVDPSKCVLMPNAVHLDQFAPGPKRPDLEARYGIGGKRVLMTFGRLDSREQAKGFDRVIALMPRLLAADPDLRYLICGKGDDRPHLEALARTHGVSDQVIFAGSVAEAEKGDHYRLADVYVMPSVSEGFGFVFLEAMACGIPCVASDADGGREAVRLGELGRVVDPMDPDQIFTATIAALREPKHVPEGLAYFSFDRFSGRLGDALGRFLD